MSEVRVRELRELVQQALEGQGFGKEHSAALAVEFVSADVVGTRTHGVGKLISMNLGDLGAKPRVTSFGSLVSVDGSGGSGFVLFRDLAQMAVTIARDNGIAAIFARNFSRYSALYPYTEIVADAGYVGVLANSAGPPAVAPHGSIDPITGTNPICFSFPTDGDTQTFDFSTSERVWGAIRQAALEEAPLPAGAFINADGLDETAPTQVNAVRPFGGPKGSALNLALELLCGAGSGAAVGLGAESEFDCGAFLLAIDPARSGLTSDFAATASRLFDEIRNSRPAQAGEAVRVPGDTPRGVRALAALPADAAIDIPEITVQQLNRMAAGERLSDLASNPLFN